MRMCRYCKKPFTPIDMCFYDPLNATYSHGSCLEDANKQNKYCLTNVEKSVEDAWEKNR